MKHTSHPTVRRDLQEWFRHCERLLASALMSDNPPFSQEELAMMKHYADEIAKISVSHDKALVPSVSENIRVQVSDSSFNHAWGGWEHHESGWWNVGKR